MARIRTIKPEFWTDERLTECSLSARLMFIGMLNFADDSGNMAYSAKRLKMQIFPADSIDTQPLLDELIAHGMLIDYSVSGEKYLHIKGFTKHQVINRPTKSAIPSPEFTDESVSTHGALIDGREGKGKEEAKAPLTPQGGTSPKERKPKSEKTGLAEFLQTCRDAGEEAIPEGDAVFAYAERIGLPSEFVSLAWAWFKARYAEKRQAGVKGWRQTFRNAVESNWPKYWFQADDGSWQLTTAGKQAKAAGGAA